MTAFWNATNSSAVALLRSTFILAFVGLFVLTGFTLQAFGMCCQESGGEQVQHVKSSPEQQLPGDTHDCQCLCHQIFADVGGVVVAVSAANHGSAEYLSCGNQYPPDSLPLGIDYPPQLG